MKKFTFLSMLLGVLFSFQFASAQVFEPEYCGSQISTTLAQNIAGAEAGSVVVGNDGDNLYIIFAANPGWDFYSNASYTGIVGGLPYYGDFDFHYYSNTTPLNYNVVTIPKDDIIMDESNCFVVSAFAYAVNPTLGISGNVWSVFSATGTDPLPAYTNYCWQACPSSVEVTGTGVFNIPEATIPLTDVENIDHVVVEAIYKALIPFDGPVEFSNELGTVKSVLPTPGILNYDRNGDGLPLPLTTKVFFTATFDEVTEGGITLNQLNNAGNIHSFIAYIYRNLTEEEVPSVFEDQHVFFYRNNEFAEPCASSYPISDPPGAYISELEIPVSNNTRNLTLQIPISELAEDDRNGFIELTAGNMTPVLHEFTHWDQGNSLRIETITVNDVPGDIDQVTVKIWSPCDEDWPAGGDSFFTSGMILDIEENIVECYPCDGQISALTLKYLGTETDATVKVYSKKVENDKLIATFYNVNTGDELSFVGTGNNNKMGSKIRITIDGANNDYTEIHTSCSQPIGVGMVFSNKSGTTETFEILAGESANGGPICAIGNPGGDPCGPCDGQVTALTLQYLGVDSDVTIKVYKDKVENDKLIATFTGVNTGEQFSFIGVGKHNKMGAKIRLTIDDENSDYVEIHTSCSQPIGVGMVFEDTYKIIAGASHEGGPLCEAANGGGNGVDPCGPCDGQMTSLTLEYLGLEEDATVKVYKDKVKNDKLLAAFTGVNNGDELFFEGVGKHKKLGAKVRITINGANNNYTEIHTSCSQPIEVGMTYFSKWGNSENFLLLAGTSHEGGALCEAGEKAATIGDLYQMMTPEEEEPLDIETSFKVYPNPMSSSTTVEFVVAETGDVSVQLVNFYGKIMKEVYRGYTVAGAKYAVKLKGQDLPTGMYFIRLINGNEVKQEKLQVIK